MGCFKWLDQQEPKSVIYVSVGSLSMFKKEDFMELWHGLVSSEVKFLWSIRPGSVEGETLDQLQFLKEEQKGLSCIVGWVPQEQVLAHSSIGGFLTHSGWASTLESIVEGVPMICWAQYVDQQVTSRLVSEVWKIGLDMKGASLDREIVEKMAREVMVTRKEEFQSSAKQLSELAKGAVAKDGSSYGDMKRLVSDIKMLNLQASKHQSKT
ncbi:hypothetical protein Leryth_007614 [Lithospermum erythrorhizon]|nr:hypothetical protein Leryth_007614 [Lithospermum erythrorhizon]